MQLVKITLLRSLQEGGLVVDYEVSSSAEEYDNLAGRQGACHDECVKNVLYRGVYGSLRSALAEWVEETTDCSRATREETKKDGTTKTVIDEYEEPFLKRAVAEEAVTVEQLQAALNEIASEPDMAFATFAAVPERKPKAKKVPKEIETYVSAKLAEGKGDALAAKLSDALGRSVAPELRPLALAIKEHRQKLLAEAQAALED